jgi:hypothetical protein
MITFESNQVQEYAAEVKAALDRCDHEEGTQCDTMDQALSFYAEWCCKFVHKVRQWASDVFAGKVAFDDVAEQYWKAELLQLFERASRMEAAGNASEDSCYMLDGLKKLRASLWSLRQLKEEWVTPALAVAPSARNQIPSHLLDRARQRIATLPALPVGHARR